MPVGWDNVTLFIFSELASIFPPESRATIELARLVVDTVFELKLEPVDTGTLFAEATILEKSYC